MNQRGFAALMTPEGLITIGLGSIILLLFIFVGGHYAQKIARLEREKEKKDFEDQK